MPPCRDRACDRRDACLPPSSRAQIRCVTECSSPTSSNRTCRRQRVIDHPARAGTHHLGRAAIAARDTEVSVARPLPTGRRRTTRPPEQCAGFGARAPPRRETTRPGARSPRSARAGRGRRGRADESSRRVRSSHLNRCSVSGRRGRRQYPEAPCPPTNESLGCREAIEGRPMRRCGRVVLAACFGRWPGARRRAHRATFGHGVRQHQRRPVVEVRLLPQQSSIRAIKGYRRS
jgi:hypothetical protein